MRGADCLRSDFAPRVVVVAAHCHAASLVARGIFFDLTPTFYNNFFIKIEEPSIVMSPAFRWSGEESARTQKRFADLVQRVLKSGAKVAAGSDRCWFYPGRAEAR